MMCVCGWECEHLVANETHWDGGSGSATVLPCDANDLNQRDDHDALLAGQKDNQHPGLHSKIAGVKTDVSQ